MWAINQPIYSVRISNQTRTSEIRVIQTYLQKLPIDMINNAKGMHQISLQFFQYIFFSVHFSPLPEFCTELCQIFPPVSLILSIFIIIQENTFFVNIWTPFLPETQDHIADIQCYYLLLSFIWLKDISLIDTGLIPLI